MSSIRKNTRSHSDAEIKNFGHLHLKYRYGYHFVAHDRLSRKNVLGGLKGSPKKRSIWSIWDDPQIVFFNSLRVEMLKPQHTIYI